MNGLESMWHTGVETLRGTPLIRIIDGWTISVPLDVLERYVVRIDDGVDHEDDRHEWERDGWHGSDGKTRNIIRLADLLNRSGNQIRVIARPGIGSIHANHVAVLNALLHITRLDPNLNVEFATGKPGLMAAAAQVMKRYPNN
ncbi:hypothetical protein [Bifidobacterium felsineum]|uniref:hypothetical protein n=1 Tax=Bifidobacterium felsineum TaxID=2045440 RepID=UPI001BDBDBE1|nr:hypothetical protein [Bifidobacterium felsineum]MBT1164615.1 hypothetical protein [Bifidobacterium felsineum]